MLYQCICAHTTFLIFLKCVNIIDTFFDPYFSLTNVHRRAYVLRVSTVFKSCNHHYMTVAAANIFPLDESLGVFHFYVTKNNVVYILVHNSL